MPQRRVRYFNADGVEVSEQVATRNGVLRDQFSLRVPHAYFRDSHFRDAREQWDADNLRVTDARAIGGVEGCRPGWRVLDNDLGRQAIADARAAYIFDLENAWRNPPPRDAAFGSPPYGAYPLSAGEGNQCTIDGRPGRLVREGDVLVCKPVRADARTVAAQTCPDCDGDGTDDNGDDCERCNGSGTLPNGDNDQELANASSDSRRMLDVDAVSAAHQKNMAKIYQQISDDVSQRWRER